jgi:aspartate aminotransferase
MAVSAKIAEYIDRSSWIRKMFEEGAKLKETHGPDKVFDFSLGNPNVAPTPEFKEALKAAASDTSPGIHSYMPNAGYEDVRAAVAKRIRDLEGYDIDHNWIVMTVGAGGALNVVLKTIVNDGDEVITPKPFFVEYVFYADNHNATAITVPTKKDFSLDLEAIEAAINPKTAALLINSPNNPTGRVYPEDQIKGLADLLENKSKQIGRPITLISDEPYRGITYDGVKVPSILRAYTNSIVVTSFSKDLSIPGERLGYIAVNPAIQDGELTMAGLILSNRILGFVNAPALQQRAVKNSINSIVDVEIYRKRRDKLHNALSSFGYDCVKPEGAFYLFPRSPTEDEIPFVNKLREKLILVVPGSGFGGPGCFRISYCVSDDTIDGSLKGFEEAIKEI